MPSLNKHARKAGFAACSAMALAVLAAGASQGVLASSDKPVDAVVRDDARAGKDLARMEARVAKSPRSASARVELARAYLAVGRFDSAAATFEDAVTLGDKNPSTGLAQALAYIGSGRNAQALMVLDRWHDRIPAADLGLAVALAGQPAQGVALLSDVVRGGDASPKARQNLAYAYALDGRWGEARVIAAQDLSADQIDVRMNEWASRTGTEQYQHRVAALLGVPVIADPGQPTALALSAPDTSVQMAQAEVAPAPEPVLAAEPVPAAPVMARAPAAELPALAAAEPGPVPTWQFAELPKPAETKVQMVSHPQVQPTPMARPQTASAPRPLGQERMAAAFAPSRSTHLVQLGSFSSKDGAKRAWSIFVARHPALKNHGMRITEAKVNGRIFFRVAAEGFERGSAQSLCASVRQRGGGCLAYASARPLPGVMPGKSGMTPLLARR